MNTDARGEIDTPGNSIMEAKSFEDDPHGADPAGSLEFARIETAQKIFGLGRSWFYRGIRKHWFQSALLRQPGAKNGVRLLHLPSVRKFITDQLATSIDPERSQAAALLRRKGGKK